MKGNKKEWDKFFTLARMMLKATLVSQWMPISFTPIVMVFLVQCSQYTCCFAEIWARALYCEAEYGTDDEGCLKNGESAFIATRLNVISGKRGTPAKIKTVRDDEKIRLVPEEC